jgi:hypothetical protein
MASAENLMTLHAHEQILCAESLAIIDKSATVKEHFGVVHEAINIVYGLTDDHPHRSDDEPKLIF